MKHYIGVYDPLTGNLELIEARNMVIRCSIREQQYDQQDEETIQVSINLLHRSQINHRCIGPTRAKNNTRTNLWN